MRIHFPVLFLVAMSIEAALGAETPALIDRPNANSGLTQIAVDIWVVDINSIGSAQQTFTADSLSSCAGRTRALHTQEREWRTTRSIKSGIHEWVSRMKRVQSLGSYRSWPRSIPMALCSAANVTSAP